MTTPIGRKNTRKGAFSDFMVGHATIPNGPRCGLDLATIENTSEDGATTPLARLRSTEQDPRMVARAGSLKRLLDPFQAQQRETLSGAPLSHSATVQ